MMDNLRNLRLSERYDDVINIGENLALNTENIVYILEELCIAYYHVKRFRESYECLEKILATRPNSVEVLDRCINNKIMFENMFTELSWQPFENRNVTVTVTSCKRLPLFLETIESFMRCLIEKHLIAEYVCVDDNSSDEDRKIMQERFPFFRFIMKGEAEKGHVESMNIIADRIKTRHLLHIEDDWLFCNRISISDMKEILDEDPSVLKQVAINKNYDEISSARSIGGDERFTKKGLRYFIHEYCTTQDDNDAFTAKHGPGMSCNYWPHFTLRPSLIDTEIFKSLNFKQVPHFEMAFAREYVDKGWKTAFLQEFNAKHLATDRTVNAYVLNHVRQF